MRHFLFVAVYVLLSLSSAFQAQDINGAVVDSTYIGEAVIEVDSTFMLDEVVVRAPRQRRYAVKEGKLVMNVQNDSLLRSLPDVHDLVSRLPGVMTHTDGQFDTELYLHDNRWSVEENSLSHPFSLANTITANIGYTIHANHRLHLYYNYNYNKQIWDSQTKQSVRLNEQAYDEVTQHRVTNDRNTTHRANLSYEGKVDKVEMSMNADYIGKRAIGVQSSQDNSTYNLQNYKVSRTRAMAGDAEMNRTNK
jgi:hypothetical protein